MNILDFLKSMWKSFTGGSFSITSDGSIRGGEKSSPFPRSSEIGNLANGLLGYSDGDSSTGSPSLIGALTSWLNAMSGEHMTNSEVERNNMQMQNQEDIFQRQVSGMQSAGLNPALMYQSGASSAPSSPTPSAPGLNMSDLMSALLIDKQSALLDAQVRKTNTESDKIAEDTEYQKLVNKFYPTLTQTQIDSVLKGIQLSDAQIAELKSQVDLNEVEKSLKEINKIVEQARADESSAYYKAVRESQEAATEKLKQEKAEIAARALIEQIEGRYMNQYNAKMGSSEIIAICTAIADAFNIDLPGIAGESGDILEKIIANTPGLVGLGGKLGKSLLRKATKNLPSK